MRFVAAGSELEGFVEAIGTGEEFVCAHYLYLPFAEINSVGWDGMGCWNVENEEEED
jgi:hypothetical protein